MPLIDLTDDEFHWMRVALENSLASAESLYAASEDALADQLDAGLLVNRYRALQEKFPAPDIVYYQMHGRLDRCRRCVGLIELVVETSTGMPEETLSSWWAHLEHPADNHDALPMGGVEA